MILTQAFNPFIKKIKKKASIKERLASMANDLKTVTNLSKEEILEN